VLLKTRLHDFTDVIQIDGFSDHHKKALGLVMAEVSLPVLKQRCLG